MPSLLALGGEGGGDGDQLQDGLVQQQRKESWSKRSVAESEEEVHRGTFQLLEYKMY